MQVTFTVTADPDEFGIFDGRDLAGALLTRAYSLIVPYARDCPACADTLFSAIVNEMIAKLHDEAEKEGGLPFLMISTHEPGPHRAIFAAAHLGVSRPESLRLLRQVNVSKDR